MCVSMCVSIYLSIYLSISVSICIYLTLLTYQQEELKDVEVEKMRLANILRRNGLRKLEAMLKQKEKLAEGLHLIDFEQVP